MSLQLEAGRTRQWGNLLHPRRRAAELSCAEAKEGLSELAEGGLAGQAVVSHVEVCLSCQAELARYHKLLALLHQLRTSEASLPDGLVADVLSALEGAASRSAIRSLLTGRRVAYAGAVLAAGGAAGSLVALARARRRAPATNRAS